MFFFMCKKLHVCKSFGYFNNLLMNLYIYIYIFCLLIKYSKGQLVCIIIIHNISNYFYQNISTVFIKDSTTCCTS